MDNSVAHLAGAEDLEEELLRFLATFESIHDPSESLPPADVAYQYAHDLTTSQIMDPSRVHHGEPSPLDVYQQYLTPPYVDFRHPHSEARMNPSPSARRTRRDKSKPKKGNNSYGRKGKERCSPCRTTHKECVFEGGAAVCLRCTGLGIGHRCDKKFGPAAEKKKFIVSLNSGGED
jgi:hypothetical protein